MPRLREVRGEYDFAVDGGAVSAITLRGGSDDVFGNILPAGTIVLGGFMEVDTPFTTGAAGQMAVHVEGAGDLIAAAVVSGAPYSTAGRKNVVPAWTGLTSLKTTVQRSIIATITVGAITAGKMRIVLFVR